MIIRKTIESDIPQALKVYDAARDYMRRGGNLRQWTSSYPGIESLRHDMSMGCSYVCVHDNRVVATFYFAIAEEPTYAIVKDGGWLNDEVYGVLHRVASDGSRGGILSEIVDFCMSKTNNLRVDTHADNKPMQEALLRKGFRYCGIIFLANGDERLAFQLTKGCQNLPVPPMTATLEGYNKHFSEKGFWDLLKRQAKTIGRATVKPALSLYYMYSDGLDFGDKLLVLGALGYLVLPADLLPDIIPMFGFSDDAAAITFVFAKFKNKATKEIEQKVAEKLKEWFG